MGCDGDARNGEQRHRVDDVFVPDERVLADRPHGVVDPPLQVILSIAIPIISAVYLGSPRAPRTPALSAVNRDDSSSNGRSA